MGHFEKVFTVKSAIRLTSQ